MGERWHGWRNIAIALKCFRQGLMRWSAAERLQLGSSDKEDHRHARRRVFLSAVYLNSDQLN